MTSTLWPLKRYIVEQTDGTTLPSKRLQREEYWYPELCNVYPYGLNDNVRGVGNVSKSDERLIVYIIIVNPRRACAARVTVLGLSLSGLFVRTRYSGSTHN